MVYALDSNSNITGVLDAIPTDGSNYCIWNATVDLQNYDYTIGSMDENHNVTWMNPPKPKPVPILIQNIQNLQQINDVLGQTAAQLQLDNMQLNTTVDTLGAMVAQSQIDIMMLKGGTV